MSDIWDQEDAKSMKSQSATNKEYTSSDDGTKQSSMSARIQTKQVGTSLIEEKQLSASPRSGTKRSSMGPRNNAEQDDTIMNQENTGTGDGANKTYANPVDTPMLSSAAENTALLTATPKSPIARQPSSQPPTTYCSPYPTVYDPTGHYASAYHRILGGSQTDEAQSTSDNGRRPPQNVDHQRLESTCQPRGRTPFAPSVPTNTRGRNDRGRSMSDNFRFGSAEPSQDRNRNYYRRSPSPDFRRVERTARNEAQLPLDGPVVIGRVVQRGRKRSRVRAVSEYEERDRSNGPSSPFDQVDTSYARMDDRHRDPEARHRMPANSRSHAPDTIATSKRPRREEHYMDDDHYSGDGNYTPDDDYMQDSDSDLFVSQTRPSRLDRSPYPDHHESRRELSMRRPDEPEYCRNLAPRARPQPKGYFSVFGQSLEPSRYSGVPMPWDISVDPEMVEQSHVSDASLLKRNIARGKGKKICKRSYGASDPENIAIVNMKEFDDLSFDEIARKLNDKRVLEGKEPSLSAVGVNSRYNRTAPLLFSSQGKEFIPLSKRRGKAREAYEASRDGIMEWDEQLDLALVNSVKEVDAARWNTVATLFEEKTGKKLNAAAAAVRHGLL